MATDRDQEAASLASSNLPAFSKAAARSMNASASKQALSAIGAPAEQIRDAVEAAMPQPGRCEPLRWKLLALTQEHGVAIEDLQPRR